MKKISLITLLLILSTTSFGQETETGQNNDETTNGNNGVTNGEPGNLNEFGFGPALFVVNYDTNILHDSKDVRLRGDGTISTSDSGYATHLGVEVHYDFSLWAKCRRLGKKSKKMCADPEKWDSTSGHTISPYLGFFDIEDGFHGISFGVMYGFWRADNQLNNRTALNVGLGWTVHKDRLVLGENLKEGEAPPPNLSVEDYTMRKDVEGVTAMISASIGF